MKRINKNPARNWKTLIGRLLKKFKNLPRKLRNWYYSISVKLMYPYQYMKANGVKKTVTAINRKVLDYFRRLTRLGLSKAGKVETARINLDYTREELPVNLVKMQGHLKEIIIISADMNSTAVKTIKDTLHHNAVQKIELMGLDGGDYSVSHLSKFQPRMVILHRVFMTDKVEALLVWAKRNYVPVIYLLEETIQIDLVSPNEVQSRKVSDYRLRQQMVYEAFNACDFVLCTTDDLLRWAERNGRTTFKWNDFSIAGSAELNKIVDEINEWYRKLHLPKFSIVSILHGKADQLDVVLHSYFRQSYLGDFELILIDDQSLDQSVEVVERFVASAYKTGKYPKIPEVKILKNDRNFGNCISRNKGILSSSGDIIIINDADCMVNKDFLKGHADAHSFDDCDVVIGPYNIETNNREPLSVLEEFEENPDLAVSESNLQDPINPRSFVNCVTRNFSIKSNFITEDLFDPLFTYSRDPNSGFGWEDIEMGYRLYKKNARIKYSTASFSIHISHPSGTDEALKPYRSLRNFRRLFEKHPEILYIARRWSLDTYNKILEWLNHYDLPANEDQQFLDRVFKRFQPAPFYIRTKKQLKILTYRWHVPHQYELYKLPHEFTLLTDLGSGMTRSWDLRQRPLPTNVKLRSIHEINPKEYDLAVLHFDENVLSPENTNGIIGGDWGKSFQWLYENLNMPKVAICHGTPQFKAQFNINYVEKDAMDVNEEERKRLVDYVEDTLVVVNSFQAQREWDFNRSKVIWHGFDPSEFPVSTREKGILSPFGPLVLSRPHYRGFFLYERIFRDFPHPYLPATLYVPEPNILYSGNEYAFGKFHNYMRELSRFSVYFNPTFRSPMPRARGEAMLCGLATVSAKNHDVELYIKNGWNGFFSNDPDELKNYLLFLMQNPKEAQRIGFRGRDTALDIFNHDRYLADWESIFSDLIG